MWKKDKADSDNADQTTDENGQDGMAAQAEDVIAFVGKGVEFKGIITYNGTVRMTESSTAKFTRKARC